MEISFRETVEDWLRELQTTAMEVDDPATEWHLKIDYPAKSGHVMHVVSPKGRPSAVVVVSGVDFAQEHLKAFETLDDGDKEQFLFELRRSLNQIDVDFQLQGITDELGCPSRFQISVLRFQDGVTLDSFARSVGAVFKTELNALWVVNRYLGPRTFGGGSRFDFKKIGM